MTTPQIQFKVSDKWQRRKREQIMAQDEVKHGKSTNEKLILSKTWQHKVNGKKIQQN